MKSPAPTLLIFLIAPPVLLACAAVGKKDAGVRIAEESAIIVWDAKSKTQHFIRHSRFQTTGYDFGFLVPTPTKPALEEAAEDLFVQLETARKPRVVTKRPWFGFGFLPKMAAAGDKASQTEMRDPGGVRVLEEKRLSGYDAAVLEADSPEAMNEWLGKNGYVSRPALLKWLEPYIKAKWKITAFKIAAGEGKAVKTSPVRLSYQTERPFYPYREPEDANALAAIQGKDPNRKLRVYFIGEERMVGEIAGKSWYSRLEYSAPLPEQHFSFNRDQWVKKSAIPVETVPAKPWMTVFTDAASPRPATDEVYFRPSADQSTIEPEPIVHHLDDPIIPLELVILGVAILVLALLLVRALRKS